MKWYQFWNWNSVIWLEILFWLDITLSIFSTDPIKSVGYMVTATVALASLLILKQLGHKHGFIKP